MGIKNIDIDDENFENGHTFSDPMVETVTTCLSVIFFLLLIDDIFCKNFLLLDR